MSNNQSKTWGQLLEQKPSLQEIRDYFKGKGGGPEGESHIIDANADKKKDLFMFIVQKQMLQRLLTAVEMQLLIIAFLIAKEFS